MNDIDLCNDLEQKELTESDQGYIVLAGLESAGPKNDSCSALSEQRASCDLLKGVIAEICCASRIAYLRLQGCLDYRTYRYFIRVVQSLYSRKEHRQLLVDLTGVHHISISGVVSLRTAAALFGGTDAPNPDHGWESIHALNNPLSQGCHRNFGLIGGVNTRNTLMRAGFRMDQEIFEEFNLAVRHLLSIDEL